MQCNRCGKESNNYILCESCYQWKKINEILFSLKHFANKNSYKTKNLFKKNEDYYKYLKNKEAFINNEYNIIKINQNLYKINFINDKRLFIFEIERFNKSITSMSIEYKLN